MPSPSLGSVQESPFLRNVAAGYSNEGYNLVNLCPIIPVGKTKGQYYTFPKAEAFSDDAEDVGTGTRSPRGTKHLSKATYELVKLAYAEEVYDDIVEEAEAPADEYLGGTETVMDKILLKRERIISNVLTESDWTGGSVTIDAGQEWDSAGGGSPLTVIKDRVLSIRDSIGLWPNIMGMDGKTALVLALHPEIRDYVKYTSTAPTTASPDVLAIIFRILKNVISEAYVNTAKKNLEASLSPIFGDYMFIGYVSNVPNRRIPSALYHFAKGMGGGVAAAGGPIPRIRTYREEADSRDVIDGDLWWNTYATGLDAGALISNTLK